MTRNLVPGTSADRLSRRSAIGQLAGASAAVAVAAAGLGVSRDAAQAATSLVGSSVATTQEESHHDRCHAHRRCPLTVVLVHGAFADGSSWSGVIERLQAQGIAVMAPANPLRGISADSAYIASVVNQIPGPVLLVGHSYGGAVISNAAPQGQERRRAGLRLRLRSRTRARPCKSLAEQSKDSHARSGAASRPVSDRPGRRAGGRVLHRPGDSSTRSSAPICRPSRRRSWPPRSGRAPRWASASRPGRSAGRRSPPGR